MELKGFRELLLKKAANDPTLQTIIDVMKDEIIAEKVLESLEKMARPQASMGRSANAAVTSYGNQMKNKDVEMMRDALAHHINHYRSALKAGKRDVADQHLNRIIPMMHLAARAGAHSGGQLGLDYVPTEPWETNYTTPKRNDEPGGNGKLKEGTKGLRRRLNSVARPSHSDFQEALKNKSEIKGMRSVPDYRYLEMAPHEEHGDSKKSPHKGGYPFEEIQLGSPAKIDAKEAYLHLHDVDPQDEYTPHPFDQHPIHSFAESKQDSLTPDQMNEFAQKMQDWHGSEHNAKWMQSLKEAHAKDPEAFKSRGKTKSGHHFEGVNLLDQPHKAKSKVDFAALPPELVAKLSEQKAPSATPAQVEAPAPTPAPAPVAQPAAMQQKPKPTLTPELAAHLPAELRVKHGMK